MAKIALQMDALASINPKGDTSFAIGLALLARGHELLHYHPRALVWQDGKLFAPLAPIKFFDREKDFYEAGKAVLTDITKLDAVLIRQNPPFDMAYITNLHLLELVQDKIAIINPPAAVRNAPEKLSVLAQYDALQKFLLPSLITRDTQKMEAFRAKEKDIVIKPLFGNGGAGVFRFAPTESNFRVVVEQFLANSPEPILLQRFLPAVRKGDKRIILIDGQAVGALNRIPRKDDIRANLGAGGTPEASELTKREQELVQALQPFFRDTGIMFAGIDVIAGYLTEINITSPTGAREIERLSGVPVASLLAEAIEKKIKA